MKIKTVAIMLGLMLHSAVWAKTTLIMATPYSEAEHHTKNIRLFVDDIAAATNGEVEIELHTAASLLEAPMIFPAVQKDEIQMGELLIASLGDIDPFFQIDTLPYVASSHEQAAKLWEFTKPYITKKLNEQGVKLLFTTPWPGVMMYSRKPITEIDQFIGQNIRAYNKMTAEVAIQLGANPLILEVGKVPAAFTDGRIDSTLTTSGIALELWNNVDYATRVNAWLAKNMVFINKEVWDNFDEKTKKIFLEVSAKAEKRGWKMSYDLDMEKDNILREKGMTVDKPKKSLQKALERVGRFMTENWANNLDEDGYELLRKYRNAN